VRTPLSPRTHTLARDSHAHRTVPTRGTGSPSHGRRNALVRSRRSRGIGCAPPLRPEPPALSPAPFQNTRERRNGAAIPALDLGFKRKRVAR
jgi:hypothetical protein